MKTISDALKAHLSQGQTTLAHLWKVTRADGTIMGFTSHDQDIVYGGVTFYASTGFVPSAVESKSDLSPDNLEVTGFLDSSAIDERDIRAGLYDYAKVEQRIVNWADLTMGDMLLRSGTVGVIKMTKGIFHAEVRGLTQYLSTVIGSLYGPLCRAELGSNPTNGIDPGTHWFCNFDLATVRQTGSVASAPDALHIVPSGITGAAGWFNDGIIAFTSGPNSGLSFEVKTWDGTTLTLFLPMPFPPAPGDTFTIEPGCNKTTDNCKNKFNNIMNFRGDPFMPLDNKYLLYPNAQIGG